MSHVAATPRARSGRFASLPENHDDLSYQGHYQHYDPEYDHGYDHGQHDVHQVSPYGSPQQQQHFSQLHSPYQQPYDPATSGTAAHDYFDRTRGYGHGRTVSDSSATQGITPSPYEYLGSSSTPPGNGSNPPTYDKQLPNYKPTPLRRPFLIALILVILGAVAALVLGLLRLPVSKASMIRRHVVDDVYFLRRADATETASGAEAQVTQIPDKGAFENLTPDVQTTPQPGLGQAGTPTPTDPGVSPGHSVVTPTESEAPPIRTETVAESDYVNPFEDPTPSNSEPSLQPTVPPDAIATDINGPSPAQNGEPSIPPQSTPDSVATDINGPSPGHNNEVDTTPEPMMGDVQPTPTPTQELGQVAIPTPIHSGTAPSDPGVTPTDPEVPPVHTTSVQVVNPSDWETLHIDPTPTSSMPIAQPTIPPESQATDLNGPDPTPDPDHGGNNGQLTTMTVASSDFAQLQPTITGSSGLTFATAPAVVLTNAAGEPTYTSVIQPASVMTPLTTIMTNAQGQLTTVVTSKPVSPSLQVLTNKSGVPTKTLTQYPMLPTTTPPKGMVVQHTTTVASYLLGMFIPTIAAVLLAIPIRILDTNARVFHPWHQLARPQGALGKRSICLEPFGWHGYLEGFRVLSSGQWLLFSTTILTIASSILIPLSTEAIRIDLQGPDCKPGTMTNKGCYFVTTAFQTGSIICIGLLGVMAIILLGLVVFMGRWKTGVAANPWSIGSIASLCLHDDVRRLFSSLPAGIDAGALPQEVVESIFESRRFRLGYFYGTTSGTMEYGIVLADHDGRSLSEKVSGGDQWGEVENMLKQHGRIEKLDRKHHLPFLMLGYVGRLLLLFILLGMLGVIGYYNATGGKTDFERFMSGEGFGVRFLFTGAGVVITIFWSSFFDSIAIISPFRLLAQGSRTAQRSILLSPPRNGFSGLWAGLRRGDYFLASTSFIMIISELLPILLCNTPFRSTQILIVGRACTYGSVSIMSIMALALMLSFCIKWPHMPLDPSTVAGTMYYVCDSWMLGGFEGGVSRLAKKERDARVRNMGLRYGFGRGVGVSGKSRISVDLSEDSRMPI